MNDKRTNEKYTQQQVEEYLSAKGFCLCGEYKNNKTPMHCIDADGYQYMIAFGGIHNRDDTPKRFHAKNPFTIANIKNYLITNNFTCELLSDTYVNSSTKLSFRCECGRIYETPWNQILSKEKRFCNYCAKSKRFDGKRDYTQEVRECCAKRGYTLITDYIHRSRDYFDYVCNKHQDKGVLTSSYDQMVVNGRGCWYCGREAIGMARRNDEQKFKEAVERAGFIYAGVDYDNENSKWKKANIHFICPKHQDKGVQTIRYNNLQRSHGNCWYCSGHDRAKEDVQQILNEQNSQIDILEYTSYNSSAFVRCRVCDKTWSTTPAALVYGRRCRYCSKSRFELEIEYWLDKWGFQYKDEYWFNDCRDINPLPFDFYLPDFNVLIEADGEQHYYPVAFGSRDEQQSLQAFYVTQKHDTIKTEYCKAHKLQLIRIPYWERDELEYFLWDELVKSHVIEETVA